MKKNNRTKKAITNIIWSFGNHMLSLVLTFISRTVFIWYLGIGYLGLNGLFTDLLSMLSLADLGLNSAMVYSFYKPLAENNKQKLAALVHFYRSIYLKIALTVFCVGVCFIPFLDKMIQLQENIPYVQCYFFLAVLNVAISYLFVYQTSVLVADQKSYFVTRVNVVVTTGKTILQIATLFIFSNYFIYLIIDLLSNLMNNIIASNVAKKQYPFILEKASLSIKEKKEIKNTIMSSFLYKISSVFLNATDNILISVLISTEAVGLYSNYFLIQSKLTLFYGLLFTSVTAGVGNLIVKECVERRYQIFQMEQTVAQFISFIAIPGYILLVNDFIRLWLGEDYCFSFAVVCAIGMNLFLGCILQPLWSYREATGLYRQTKYVMLICAILNVLLSIIGGFFVGVFGIVAASAIARICTYVWYEPKLLYKMYFEKSSYKYLIDLGKNALFLAVFTIFITVVSNFWHVESWGQWFFKVGLVISTCIGIGYLYCRKKDGFLLLQVKIKSIL